MPSPYDLFFFDREKKKKEKEKEEREGKSKTSRSEKFFKKDGETASGKELLRALSEVEGADSPFRKLYDRIRDQNAPNEQTEEALRDFLDSAKGEVMKDVKQMVKRFREAQTKELSEEKEKDTGLYMSRFHHRMNLRMNLLKKVMTEDQFNSLCSDIRDLGLPVDPRAYQGMTPFEIKMSKLAAEHERLTVLKTGRPPGYFRMMNSIGSFLGSKGADKNLKEAAIKDIGNFILNDCAPGKKGVDQDAFQSAMRSMKALVSEKAFNQFLGLVNSQPGRRVQYKPDDFRQPPEADTPENRKDLDAPVLRPSAPPFE